MPDWRSSWFGLKPSPHADYLPRYQHLRQVGVHLNTRLVASLPRRALDEGGKKLGILKKNVLLLNNEDEIAVMMDYCLYNVRWDGRTAIEHFLAESPPPAGSDEMVLLQAMLQARYSVYEVEGAAPGVGVHVRDLMLDEPLFLMDIGFSQSAVKGMVVGSHVFAPEGIHRTTGAALPVGVRDESQREALLRNLRAMLPGGDYRGATSGQRAEFAARVIRTCLRGGASDHIQYVEPDQEPRAAPRPRQRSRFTPQTGGKKSSNTVGRNDPCPCGSGKKYKECCLKRA